MDGRLLQYVSVLLTSLVVLYMSYITSMRSTSLSHLKTKKVLQDRLPSSIWCTFGPAKERLCKFKNICFDPLYHEFQFLLTEDSIVSGVESTEAWMNIPLSTVLGHNAFYMKISLVKPGNRNLKDFVYFNSSPTFLIHRFKSDNIMHVLHDDLLPLHFTYESISHSDYNMGQHASLAFVDSNRESFADKWYNNYSKRNFIYLSHGNDTICFADAFVGLLRSTLWFNYGFGKPQGPHVNDQFNVRAVRNFVEQNLLWNKISTNHAMLSSIYEKAVVIIRSQTRRILNLNALLKVISKAHSSVFPNQKLHIITLDLTIHNTTYVLSQISNAKLLVGMHGAGMIMSLFLPPWASVVELFPFAINPDHVSFLKALTSQSERYPIHYEPWKNAHRENAQPGSHNSPFLGQITHLPPHKQKEIMSISEVGAVHCCHDPTYLYYMYHDTKISDDVYHSIHRAWTKTKEKYTFSRLNEQIFPSLLSSFSCEVVGDVLTLQWGDFSNQKEVKSLWFQITVQNGNVIIVKNETDCAKRKLQLNLGIVQAEIHGWIQPYNDVLGGHTIHSRCVPKK